VSTAPTGRASPRIDGVFLDSHRDRIEAVLEMLERDTT
jgi:hypothetical protein